MFEALDSRPTNRLGLGDPRSYIHDNDTFEILKLYVGDIVVA